MPKPSVETKEGRIEAAVREFLNLRMVPKRGSCGRHEELQRAEMGGFRRAQQALRKLLPEDSP